MAESRAMMRWGAAVFLGAVASAPGWAADLPVGVIAQDGPLGITLRTAALLGGLFLLLAGRWFERAVVGAFALLLGLAAGVSLLGDAGYGFGLLAAWLVAAVALLVHAFAPRVAWGAACLFPLPALYGFWLYGSGKFGGGFVLPLCLAAAGAILGASAPRLGSALFSAAMGTALAVAALPREIAFGWVVTLGTGGLLVQLVLLPLVLPVAPRGASGDTLGLSVRRARWLQGARASLYALLGLAAAVGLLAPRVTPQSAPHTARLSKAGAGDALARPGLLFDPADSLYLSGRPVRAAMVGGTGTLWDRLALPLLGRNPAKVIHALRAVKEPAELVSMRRAAQITSAAFGDAERVVRPGASEKEVERAILDSFTRQGATGLAFPCVVGAGRNATAPHYMKNDCVMGGGLVVVDIGCSVDGYASDMTRTFAVSGRYTPAERKLLDTVVTAGDAARALLKAGASYSALEKAAREVIKKAGFGDYFLHALGHPVGLDVHDPYRDKLEAGMVVTIEPGIYICAGSDAPKEYWDLGVRIEDSYLVTADGYEELTHYPRIPPERETLPAP